MIDERKVTEIKSRAFEMCSRAGAGHVTSAFSIAEVVSVLYYEVMRIDPKNPAWEDRDRFVMSKNHASVITYPILQDLGFLDPNARFLENGSKIGIHSKPGVPGVDFAGGSLGIGIGFACGEAYRAKITGKDYRVYCVVGDGECYEGSVWEAFLFAGAKELGNLVVVIDRNRLAITDFTEHMLPLDSLKEKTEAFRFDTLEIDGHDLGAIREAFRTASAPRKKPLCIIANTVKGHGVDFLESVPLWHGRAPVGDDAEKARKQLSEALYGC